MSCRPTPARAPSPVRVSSLDAHPKSQYLRTTYREQKPHYTFLDLRGNLVAKLAFLSLLVACLLVSFTAGASETSSRPLRQTELLALVAGNALPENIVNEIHTRGIAFRMDDSFRAQLKTAGATPSVLAALGAAKPPANATEDKPDP